MIRQSRWSKRNSGGGDHDAKGDLILSTQSQQHTIIMNLMILSINIASESLLVCISISISISTTTTRQRFPVPGTAGAWSIIPLSSSMSSSTSSMRSSVNGEW